MSELADWISEHKPDWVVVETDYGIVAGDPEWVEEQNVEDCIFTRARRLVAGSWY